MRNLYWPSWGQAGDMHAFALISREAKWSIWEQRCTAGQSSSLPPSRQIISFVWYTICCFVALFHNGHLAQATRNQKLHSTIYQAQKLSQSLGNTAAGQVESGDVEKERGERALVPRGGKGRRCSSAKLNNSDLASDGGKERRGERDRISDCNSLSY